MSRGNARKRFGLIIDKNWLALGVCMSKDFSTKQAYHLQHDIKHYGTLGSPKTANYVYFGKKGTWERFWERGSVKGTGTGTLTGTFRGTSLGTWELRWERGNKRGNLVGNVGTCLGR